MINIQICPDAGTTLIHLSETHGKVHHVEYGELGVLAEIEEATGRLVGLEVRDTQISVESIG